MEDPHAKTALMTLDIATGVHGTLTGGDINVLSALMEQSMIQSQETVSMNVVDLNPSF